MLLDRSTALDFVDHHPRYCSPNGSACEDIRRQPPRQKTAARMLAHVLAQGHHGIDRCRHVARVEVQREQLLIELAELEGVDRQGTLHIPWQKTIGKRRREILLPEGMPPRHVRPIRSETRT